MSRQDHFDLIIRPEVAEFAAAMEAKLKKNDHKTDWHQQPIEAHIKLLKIEIEEFMVALEYFGDEEAAKECVDIANFAMIIRDKLLARIKALNELPPKFSDEGLKVGSTLRIKLPDDYKVTNE